MEIRVRSNHEPVTDADRLLSTFGVALPTDVEPGRPEGAGFMAPFIVQALHPTGDALGDVNVGMLGLLPAMAQHIGTAAQTRHCRVEIMKSDPTFRESWWSGRRCVVPVERLTEWGHAPGRPVALTLSSDAGEVRVTLRNPLPGTPDAAGEPGQAPTAPSGTGPGA